MAYADFTYYTDTYLGDVDAIAAADFPRLAARASAIIDQLTYHRTAAVVTAAEDAELIDLVKMATCAVVDEIHKTEQRAEDGGGVIQSERVGQHSVTFAVASDANLSALSRYRNAAGLYLDQTVLMFGGLNEDER